MRWSFRNRLTFFFVLIVLVPMVAVAFVLLRLVSDSEAGKANARLAQAQQASSALFVRTRDRAMAAGERIGTDRTLATALRTAGAAGIRERLEQLAAREDLVTAWLSGRGVPTVRVGGGDPVAVARTRLVGSGGDEVASLLTSTTDARQFVELLRETTGMEVVITREDRVLASSLPPGTLDARATARLPLHGDGTVAGADYRIAGFTAPVVADEGQLTIRLLADDRQTTLSTANASGAFVAILVAFVAVAVMLALVVSRSLEAQVRRLLEAARRIGEGDLSTQVPVEGADEFAALAREFNAMARQLEARVAELGTERERLRGAIGRLGESFASNLDRDALLALAVETAVDGTGADGGRALLREHGSDELVESVSTGPPSAAVLAAEGDAKRTRVRSEHTRDGRTAIAQPLRSLRDGSLLGLLTVTRERGIFDESDRSLLGYLAGRAAVSLENVGMHESVRRQAVTDELTGLSNHRRFQEVMRVEIERARRYGAPLGLVLLDVDDFKRVNDTHGHLQGDEVLREVARVLRETARDMDEPARYGGEEMAVALPQTDLDGAYHFAERVRERIAALRIPLVEGPGEVGVTASFGVTSLAGDTAGSPGTMVAEADAALYQAKRAGKNRTVRGAPGTDSGGASG